MNLATLKYQYEGPVFTNKVSDEQKASARAMEAFTNELRGMFRQQFGRFTGILNYLEGQLKPVMQEGFFEGEETALRTSATENITDEYTKAMQAFQSRAFVLGGRELPSGTLLQTQQQLEQARAGQEAGAQREITQFGANRRLQAAQMLAGIANMQNPAALMSGAIQSGQNSYGAIKESFPASNWLSGLLGIAGGLASLIPGVGPFVGPALSAFGIQSANFGGGLSGVPNPLSNEQVIYDTPSTQSLPDLLSF
jgi:hypothetical protein